MRQSALNQHGSLCRVLPARVRRLALSPSLESARFLRFLRTPSILLCFFFLSLMITHTHTLSFIHQLTHAFFQCIHNRSCLSITIENSDALKFISGVGRRRRLDITIASCVRRPAGDESFNLHARACSTDSIDHAYDHSGSTESERNELQCDRETAAVCVN